MNKQLKQLIEVITPVVQLLNLKQFVKSTGRKLAIPIIQLLSIGVYWKKFNIKTKKSVYETLDISQYCSYKTLCVNLNKFAVILLALLKLAMKHNVEIAETIKHIDSTDVPVCLIKNSKHHQTMKGKAEYGHSGKGFYYGLKMHLVSDLSGRFLNLQFTPANVHDTKPVESLTKDVNGILVADAGYVSKELEQKMQREGLRYMIVKPKRNMKRLATAFDTWAYSTRMQIETNFRNLKEFYGLVTSLPRSVQGYLANYIFALTNCFLK